jgi:alpha-aminoadipic semialdehyde synthase
MIYFSSIFFLVCTLVCLNDYVSRLTIQSTQIAPYASVIINGIYWAPDCSKLLTVPDAKTLLSPSQLPWIQISEGAPGLPHRLLGICDISADPGGSIEFMNECTTIDNPFCLYDAHLHKDTKRYVLLLMF